MPCRSDYLEQSATEAHHQRIARLLAYALKRLGRPVSAEIQNTADNYYAATDFTTTLCMLIDNLKPDEREAVVYNAKDRDARRLADWVEEHDEADRRRRNQEAEQHKRDALIRGAVAKLTPEERKALGLP